VIGFLGWVHLQILQDTFINSVGVVGSELMDIKTGYYMYGGTQMPGSENGGF